MIDKLVFTSRLVAVDVSFDTYVWEHNLTKNTFDVRKTVILHPSKKRGGQGVLVSSLKDMNLNVSGI